MGTFLAFMGNSVYLCRVVKTKRSLKNVHIKVDRDTLQIFMKCREKRCPQWRASTARCLTAGGLQSEWRPQILYLVGVSSHPLVWLLIDKEWNTWLRQRVPLLFYQVVIKKHGRLGHLREKVYICTVKLNIIKNNEGIFI